MTDDNIRYSLLKAYTSNENIISELLAYSKNKFSTKNINSSNYDCCDEEPYSITWEAYHKESDTIGVFETLKKYLVQLQFPVEKNISVTEAYRNATLKGVSTETMKAASGLVLNNPKAIRLSIHQSLVGKIPVLIVPDEQDFCAIIQALLCKNEPEHLPKSMGAAIINGINNWDRIHRLKKEWQQSNPFESWGPYFKEYILPHPKLYKDKIIVLSTKPYSNTTAKNMNLPLTQWIDYSLQIRLEHECAHLFTLKYFGQMANNMHDEIIADYAGITKVLGQFNKEWFLYFLGLENYPQYRKGGRLENYLGDKGLSTEAFEVLLKLVKKIADNISEFDKSLGPITTSKDQLKRIICICELDLITMASPKGFQNLITHYKSKENELAL
ncbi:hypothetical protein ABW636_21930 [Aquimarina sp. 2201CG1-2-11]|uniref:DUF7005 family protein n=1 Tax=Aquimarina discodermiae TaxID=3231043 RepID=UPI0034619EAD